MANLKTRSRDDNVRELARLQSMYQRLPPEKQKAARGHMQARINELQDAINGKGKTKAGGGGMSVLQTVMIVLLASVVAVALGFFGVTFMAKG